MAHFTDQKSRIATPEDCKAKWSGGSDGKFFRCYLCGHRFQPNDIWRWVYANGQTVEINNKIYGLSNFLVCDACDNDDIIESWKTANKELYTRFWWAF